MEQINANVIYALLVLLGAVMSLITFYLGRRRDATEMGIKDGMLTQSLQTLQLSLNEMKSSIERINNKMDMTDERREREYRDILVAYAKLEESYKSLHKRVDSLEYRSGVPQPISR